MEIIRQAEKKRVAQNVRGPVAKKSELACRVG
jgi:hypothetical protein